MTDNQKLQFRVGPPAFALTASRKDRCILVGWGRRTLLDNVTWHNTWCIRWGWPPIAHFKGLYIDEPEGQTERT